jgi:LacI family transcriptional regulator
VLFGRESDVAEQGLFLERHGIPFVVTGRHERAFPQWCQVDYNHEGMMRRVVEHFARLGHRRIAYMGYYEGQVYQERLYDGFRAAARGVLGVDPDERLIALFDPRPSPTEAHRSEAHVEAWLSLPETEQPTAIAIGASENEWWAIERVLARRGRAVGEGPGQIAVAGQGAQTVTAAFSLAFGHGYYFSDISYASIAEVAVRDLLLPLLAGETLAPSVRRILPDLVPIRSLELPVPIHLPAQPTPKPLSLP